VWRPSVDLVVFVLALALALVLVILVLTVAIVAVIEGEPANPLLGANTTDILGTAIAGIVGVIGSYVGYHLHDRRDD
jgi:hypothetical protein